MTKSLGLLAMSRMQLAMVAGGLCAFMLSLPAIAGGPIEPDSYKVLPPIVRGNLAIFPVVAARSFDTAEFITLDEGVRSGQVMVKEAGDEGGFVRPGQAISPGPSARVNNLVLYNNSSRPLLLLAGEIVTGGKQDRVIGSDRIVPANTGPIDLGVFCVEPGRWVGATSKFGSMGAQMAQPSVRTPAMAERDQLQVWANVRKSNARIANSLAAPEAAAVAGTTSYAKVFQSAPVERVVAGYGGPEAEQAILRDLREKNATGVVVAVNGAIVWADVFASTDLLAKYWPKLMRSYVAEAITSGNNGGGANLHEADLYMRSLTGGREIVETEAGVFRRTEITGDTYRVFELTSLLPKTDFTVHITKMREELRVVD